MFCRYCGNEVPNDAEFCSKCGKALMENTTQQMNTYVHNEDKKKGMAVVSLVLGLVGLIALLILLLGFYMGYNGLFWFQQINVSDEVEKEDIQSEEETKVYRVVSDTKFSRDDMYSIVYYLQRRADNYTTEAVVLMKERNSEWYVEICMPGMDDETYSEVIRNTELKFVGGYGTPTEEIIVTNQNIKSASASAVDDSITGIRSYIVSISFDDEGTEAFAEGTEKYIGSQISIVLDGEVISAPYVNCAITGGEAQITVDSYKEAKVLAALLRVGYLGFELEEVK